MDLSASQGYLYQTVKVEGKQIEKLPRDDSKDIQDHGDLKIEDTFRNQRLLTGQFNSTVCPTSHYNSN